MSEPILTKQCSKCKQIKSISEFNKQSTCKNGIRSYCKSCQKVMDRNYEKTTKGKTVRRKALKKYRKTAKGKAARKASLKRFYAYNPNHKKAGDAVNHAIRDGKLISPKFLLCHYCPKPAQQYHHWHGYEPEHWLDIVPACKSCHVKEHKKAG